MALSERKFITTGSIYEKMAGYSRAVVDGDMVFVSGTVGSDFKTKTFPEGAEAQTEKAVETILWALNEAGATALDVVQVRAYIPDIKDVMPVSMILAKHFGEAKPTNTTICSPLAVPEAKVEIEVTAKKRSK